ncbi:MULTISPECIES: hypothetical protein [unclassified Clostridium]|uniref:hypothetical protein n=1 Tax=unclassified Clostridium TaxID=2614128 RepID=UPI0025C0944E|nr:MULTISPECIES: hypothetical protein [unclassified Clostridium]
MSGKEALIELLNGGTVEFGERYYRYNHYKNIIEWDDYKQGNWKVSSITINDFLAVQLWNRLE